MSEHNLFFSDNLRKFVDIIDNLRDIGIESQFKLPRISVLGTQSSGKTSLLESIVGLDFLPRGEGIVTRVPLELRLIHMSEAGMEPYAIFEKNKDKKYTDFSQVKAHIIESTDQIAGSNKGIVDQPLILTIYSNSCPDLTLIDLPGITKIPLNGSDQKEDIEKITKSMSLRYCTDPMTIILCVVSANADLSTSEALKIAKDLDPTGERTIGVLTKIDIMDKGTDAAKILKNNEIYLKLGYVAVKNRSQMDINNGMKVLEALEEERKFFASHCIYSALPKGCCGTQILSNKLKEIFYEHISKFFPEIVSKINSQFKEKEKRIRELGPNIPLKECDKFSYLWSLVMKFCLSFQNALTGGYDKSCKMDTKLKIPIRGQIQTIFEKVYWQYSHDFNATKDYSDKEIKEIMDKYEGDTLIGFQSIDAFYAILMPLLSELKEPAEEALERVSEILKDVASQCLSQECSRYPNLYEEMYEIIKDFLDQQRDKCHEILMDRIECETNYIYSNDNEYINKEMEKFMDNMKTRDKGVSFQIAELRKKIDIYFNLIKRNLNDSIPKVIGFFLIKSIQHDISSFLQDQIMINEKLKQSLEESQSIVDERYQLSESLKSLEKARKIISKDHDLFKIYQKEVLITEKNTKPKKEQEEKKQKTPRNSNPKIEQLEKDPTPLSKQKTDYQNIDLLTSEFDKISTNNYNNNKPSNQKQALSSNPLEEEPKLNKVQETVTLVKNNTNNPNPGLYGGGNQQPQSKISVQQNPQSNANLVKTPQIFVENKNTNTNTQNNNFNNNNNKASNQNNAENNKNGSKTDKFIDNSTDKAFDALWENEKFQKGLKDGAKNAAYNVVASRVPIKGDPGVKHPLGSMAEKLTEKALENDKVQQSLKDAAKNATKDAIKKEVNAKPVEKKKTGLFSFI